MGNWDEVNQKIQELWYGFWDIVGEVINAIWDIVVTIVTVILPAVLIAIGTVVVATAIIAIFSPLVATAFLEAMVAVAVGLVELGVVIATATFDFAVLLIDATITGFATLIDAINLDAILEVHEIMWILSDDYRQLIGLLFDEISKVSEVLFGNGMILHLMVRGTRSLIMSAANLLGRPFDWAEATWLVNFEEILLKFNEKAETYMTDPEQLFIDLSDWAEKNALDISGLTQATALKQHELNLEFIRINALKLKETSDSYNAFAFALPGNRGRAIRSETDPINRRLGAFQFSSYERNRFNTDRAIERNTLDQERSRERMRGIEYDTDRPSRGLSKIDELPPDDREVEEQVIEDYATRELDRDNVELTKQHDEYIEKEEAEKVEKEVFLPPPTWQAITEKETTVLAMSKSRLRNTPFVGDY